MGKMSLKKKDVKRMKKYLWRQNTFLGGEYHCQFI